MNNSVYNFHFMELETDLQIQDGTSSFDSDELEIHIDELDEGLALGQYQYESEPLFGSPTVASGRIIFDVGTPLAAFTTVADRPTRDKLARAFGDALSTEVTAPTIDADRQYALFESSGVSGPTSTRFKSEQSTYEVNGQVYSSVTPEERAKTRAQAGPHITLSEATMRDAMDDFMEDGMYIDMMKIRLQDSLITYSSPLSFFGVSKDNADDWVVRTLFEEARILAGHRTRVDS